MATGSTKQSEHSPPQPPSRAWPPVLARALDGAGYQAMLAAQAVWLVSHKGLVASGLIVTAAAIGSALAAPAMRVLRSYQPRTALLIGVGVSVLLRVALGPITSYAPLTITFIITLAMTAASWVPDIHTKNDVLARSRTTSTLATLLFVVTVAHALGSAAPTALSNPTQAAILTAICIISALLLLPSIWLVRPHPTSTDSTTKPDATFTWTLRVLLLALAASGPTAIWAALCTSIVGQRYVSILGLLYVVSAALAVPIGKKLNFQRSHRRIIAIAVAASGMMWFVGQHQPSWFLATMVLSCLWVIVLVGVVLTDAGKRGGAHQMAAATTVIAVATAVTAIVTPVLYEHFGTSGVGASMVFPALLAIPFL
jgi:predicted MFS family arabinose efflux permease